jgi:hypothetical protein
MEKMNDTIKNWREVNKWEELHGDYPMMSTIYLLSLSIFF